jgi:eukaryotic-like serine/threonine-protein kinase
MVRDDFWMAVTRFMRELEVRLLEGHNSALVDLFDPTTHEKVLAAFGRAFGTLPDNISETTKEQKSSSSSRSLVWPRKAKSSAFAGAVCRNDEGQSMDAGHAERSRRHKGVGVTFLEETFSASTAPPEHRYHQKAARAVLKDLLPDSGTTSRATCGPTPSCWKPADTAVAPKTSTI